MSYLNNKMRKINYMFILMFFIQSCQNSNSSDYSNKIDDSNSFGNVDSISSESSFEDGNIIENT